MIWLFCNSTNRSHRIAVAAAPEKVTRDDFELVAMLGKGKFGSVLLVRRLGPSQTNDFYAMKVVNKGGPPACRTSGQSEVSVVHPGHCVQPSSAQCKETFPPKGDGHSDRVEASVLCTGRLCALWGRGTCSLQILLSTF